MDIIINFLIDILKILGLVFVGVFMSILIGVLIAYAKEVILDK